MQIIVVIGCVVLLGAAVGAGVLMGFYDIMGNALGRYRRQNGSNG